MELAVAEREKAKLAKEVEKLRQEKSALEDQLRKVQDNEQTAARIVQRVNAKREIAKRRVHELRERLIDETRAQTAYDSWELARVIRVQQQLKQRRAQTYGVLRQLAKELQYKGSLESLKRALMFRRFKDDLDYLRERPKLRFAPAQPYYK